MQGFIASGIARASDEEIELLCRMFETLGRAWRTGDPADEAEAQATEAALYALMARKANGQAGKGHASDGNQPHAGELPAAPDAG